MRSAIISISIFLLLASFSWAQESSLTLAETKVEPSNVNAGGRVVISCQVTHSDGPINIERVAARVSSGNLNTSYPMLYDDGTNGDMVADDGIYSLEITAGNIAGEAKIVFIAVDTERNEIESAPVILTIK